MAHAARKLAQDDLLPIKSVSFSAPIRFPGGSKMSERMTVGTTGAVSTVSALEVDWTLRVVWVTVRLDKDKVLQRVVPFEAVLEFEP